MASIASPTAAMPGAFTFADSRRQHPSLSIQTSARPLSTFSTDTAYYSPEEGNSPASIITQPFSAIESNDDSLQSELAALECLRKDVRKNLSLRPLTSLKRPVAVPPDSPVLFSYSTAPSSPIFSPSIYSPAPSPSPLNFGADLHHTTPPSDEIQSLTPIHLAVLLASTDAYPLILDTRPPRDFFTSHISNSVNLAIPSLILRRCRRPGALASIDSLRTFIANRDCIQHWESLMSGATRWSG